MHRAKTAARRLSKTRHFLARLYNIFSYRFFSDVSTLVLLLSAIHESDVGKASRFAS
jgi:hypothetical protein